MKRDPGPLPALFVLGGFIAVSAALVLVDRYAGRGRPTELLLAPPDNRPDVPPWMKICYLECALQDAAPDLRVIHWAGSANCVVIGPDVDAATLDGRLPTEEFADCWRDVVLCEANWEVLEPDEAAKPDGPHACRVGDFRLFGDLELIDRIMPLSGWIDPPVTQGRLTRGPHAGQNTQVVRQPECFRCGVLL